MTRVFCPRKVKGMSTVPGTSRGRCGQRGDVRQQLQAKVSDNLASRGVIYNRERLFERKPSTELSEEDFSRLEKQRYNKRKWAQKERARYRKELESLQTKNGTLIHANQSLKESIKNLTEFKSRFHSAMAKHELSRKCRRHSTHSLFALGERLHNGDVDMKVQVVGTQVIPFSMLTPTYTTSSRVLLCNLSSDGEEEGPMKRLTTKWIHINNGSILPGGRIVDQQTQIRPATKSNSKPKPAATITSAMSIQSPGLRKQFAQSKTTPPVEIQARKRAESETTEDSDDETVLTSSGFVPREESAESGHTSYLQLLNEGGEDALAANDTTPEVTGEPGNAEDAVFLQQVHLYTPNLEQLIQQRNRNEATDPAQHNYSLTAPETVIAKRSSLEEICPWFVTAETTLKTETVVSDTDIIQTYAAEEIVSSADTTTIAETDLQAIRTPPINISRRRTMSEAATFSEVGSAPARMVTISEGSWTEGDRVVLPRAQSLPADYELNFYPSVVKVEQDVDEPPKLIQAHDALCCPTLEEEEPPQLFPAILDVHGHDYYGGDVLEVVEVVDNETDMQWEREGHLETEETEFQQMSRDPQVQPETLVSINELPPTPSTPSTDSPVLSTSLIHSNSSVEAFDTTYMNVSRENASAVSYIMVQ